MLVKDLRVRVTSAATGELIRELDIDPARPPTKTTPNPIGVQGHSDVLRHHMARSEGLEPPTF
jgi:hypothetical protein